MRYKVFKCKQYPRLVNRAGNYFADLSIDQSTLNILHSLTQGIYGPAFFLVATPGRDILLSISERPYISKSSQESPSLIMTL